MKQICSWQMKSNKNVHFQKHWMYIQCHSSSNINKCFAVCHRNRSYNETMETQRYGHLMNWTLSLVAILCHMTSPQCNLVGLVIWEYWRKSCSIDASSSFSFQFVDKIKYLFLFGVYNYNQDITIHMWCIQRVYWVYGRRFSFTT